MSVSQGGTFSSAAQISGLPWRLGLFQQEPGDEQAVVVGACLRHVGKAALPHRGLPVAPRKHHLCACKRPWPLSGAQKNTDKQNMGPKFSRFVLTELSMRCRTDWCSQANFWHAQPQFNWQLEKEESINIVLYNERFTGCWSIKAVTTTNRPERPQFFLLCMEACLHGRLHAHGCFLKGLLCVQ
jgi:hypothetical protein